MNGIGRISGYPGWALQDAEKLRRLEQKAWEAFGLLGFRPCYTPAAEPSWAFEKAAGATSDMALKEMVKAGSGDGCLRPEGTAGAVLTWLAQPGGDLRPARWAYCQAMFRAERAGLGRFRQFTQFGAEGLGIPFGLFDAELACAGSEFLAAAGACAKLRVNWLKTGSDRLALEQELRSLALSRAQDLRPEDLARAKSAPLRLLDAPPAGMEDALRALAGQMGGPTGEDADKFAAWKEDLGVLGVEFETDPGLARGLDYYGGPIFEWSAMAGGREMAVGGGGRYDGLAKLLGARQGAPAAGLAFGLERLAMALPELACERSGSQICWQGDGARAEALLAARRLRRQGMPAWCDSAGGNFGKMSSRADKLNASGAFFLGEREALSGRARWRSFEEALEGESDLASPQEAIANARKAAGPGAQGPAEG